MDIFFYVVYLIAGLSTIAVMVMCLLGLGGITLLGRIGSSIRARFTRKAAAAAATENGGDR